MASPKQRSTSSTSPLPPAHRKPLPTELPSTVGHNGRPPAGQIVCRLCDRTFTKMKSLYRHLDSVHSIATYRCVQCGRDFARRDILGRHAAQDCPSVCNAKARHRRQRGRSLRLASNKSNIYAVSGVSVKDANIRGYPGATDDPFLVVLGMVDLIRPANITETPSTSTTGQRKFSFVIWKYQLDWWIMKASLLQLLRERVADEAHIAQSNSTWLASLILALVEGYLDGPRSCSTEVEHLTKGGHASLACRHRLLCCQGKEICSSWLETVCADPCIHLAAEMLQRHRLSMHPPEIIVQGRTPLDIEKSLKAAWSWKNPTS
jgi:hypothetical protein